MPRTPFGDYLFKRRNTLRPPLTQADIAKRLTDMGFKHSSVSISHWESQKRQITPNFNDRDLIRAIADILQTTPYKLREAAGFNEGIDEPLAGIDAEILSKLHLLTEDRKKLYLMMIDSDLSLQHRE